MNTPDETTRCGILYIDDEEHSLKYFRIIFGKQYRIYTASNAEEGLEILEHEAPHIAVLVSDQRMPGKQGTDVLETARERYPWIVRILTTAYTDIKAAVEAVNRGHVYQYINKPWQMSELQVMVLRAVDYFRILQERKELVSLKMGTLQRILCSDRLKWLLLAAAACEPTRRTAFQNAVAAMVDVLPDVLHPGGDGAAYRREDFELVDILRGEYRNARRCMEAFQRAAAEDRTVDALFEELKAAIAQRFGPATGQITIEPGGGEVSGGHLIMHPSRKVFSMMKLSEALFGVLFDRGDPEVSLQLLELLIAFAGRQESLRISIEPTRRSLAAESIVFTTNLRVADPFEHAISALYGKFSTWDIERR